MQEFTLTITIGEHGYSEEAAEKTLDAFLKLVPDAGPVVSQNLAQGTLSITIGLQATDPWAASNIGRDRLAEGLTEAGLAFTSVVDLCVTASDYQAPRHVHRGELVSA